MIDRFYNAFSSKGAHLLKAPDSIHLPQVCSYLYDAGYPLARLPAPACLPGCLPTAILIGRPPGDVRCSFREWFNGTTPLETKNGNQVHSGVPLSCFSGKCLFSWTREMHFDLKTRLFITMQSCSVPLWSAWQTTIAILILNGDGCSKMLYKGHVYNSRTFEQTSIIRKKFRKLK